MISAVEINEAIDATGYHPALVSEAVSDALGSDEPLAHFVAQETTFDSHEVRRHVTVAIVTETNFIVVHVDDEEVDGKTVVTATSESVSRNQIRSVMITRSADPSGKLAEVLVGIGWGGISRVELEPNDCGNPNCDGDHGYSGVITSEDIQLRASRLAEGEESVRALLAFARTIQVSK
ncbi:MAG: phosphodiesterase [Actinobacteria bacterium]|nr:phosphodiesterase [Actinomycetota bacterium]